MHPWVPGGRWPAKGCLVGCDIRIFLDGIVTAAIRIDGLFHSSRGGLYLDGLYGRGKLFFAVPHPDAAGRTMDRREMEGSASTSTFWIFRRCVMPNGDLVHGSRVGSDEGISTHRCVEWEVDAGTSW